MKYISEQITKAEREGWFDAVNYPNAVACMELLKSIRIYCDTQMKGLAADSEGQQDD